MAELSTMTIDGDNLKPVLFILRNGKEIKSATFNYGKRLIHGTTIDKKSFNFSIDDLEKIKRLNNESGEIKTEAKENPKAKRRGRKKH